MASLSLAGGLPLGVVLSTIPAWLADHGVKASDIGLLSIAGLPWSFKFLWSPILDRWSPPFGGRRRGWMIIAQAALLAAVLGFGGLDPTATTVVLIATAGIAFLSATQDIAMDGYAVELMRPEEQGPGNAMRTTFYRLGMILASGVAIAAAGQLGWSPIFLGLALLFAMAIALTATARDPAVPPRPAATLQEAVVGPLVSFFSMMRSLGLAALILLYKFGDNMTLSVLAPFFQQELHVSLTEIGTAQKTIGMFATIGGVLLGGALLPRLGLLRALWVYAAAQAGANALYAATAWTGGYRPIMYGTIALESACAGMGTAALLTLITRIVDKRYTATQFALLTSMIGLGRTLAGVPSGYLAQTVGYGPFFLLTILAAVPSVLLLKHLGPSIAATEAEG